MRCQRNNIKAAGWHGSAPQPTAYIILRRQNQFSLLARIHRNGGAAKPGIAAKSDFDKDQVFAVASDDVDLAKAAAKIARNNLESLLM